MNIGIVTNIRSPYRKLQMESIINTSNYDLNIYYTDKDIIGRKWIVDKIKGANEIGLKGISLSKRYGNINKGLVKIVKTNDILLLGGYEKPTYIVLSILARIYKKPYILIYDGISPEKIKSKESSLKFFLKKLVINGSSGIFGNGTVSKQYFVRKFNYPTEKIYNQYLTVDTKKIFELSKNKLCYKKEIQERYQLPQNKKVIMYSGRLINRKNVDKIILAISKMDNPSEYLLLIVGDGPLRQSLLSYAEKLNVNILITGFISEQIDLFKHYFVGDVLVLPSYDEPWGLVINEAMAAGLPIISSNECGATLDLVKEKHNGYIVKAGNENDIKKAFTDLFNVDNSYGEISKNIISNWTFLNSAEQFKKMINNITKSKEG
ncbi:Glycosyltransferase involved in cell wall bisynthesis [Bacillus sp. OV194]|nr:Glycosyltransferase involved in cell wall bisynthesis [Bacillus sp. OV194]